MAAQKCKIILLQAILKDLWSSANLKLKKFSLSKLSLFKIIYIKKSKNGSSYLGVTFVCKWFKILLHSEFSEKSLTLKDCKPIKGMTIIW